MARTVLLIGPPGSGKTTMACLTAKRKPAHALDIDRKIAGQANLEGAIANGDLTFWEVSEPLVEVSLSNRAKELSTNTKMTKPPKGWLRYAQLVDDLTTKPEGLNAGTWVVDSYTFLATHLLRHIMYVSNNTSGNMRPQDWGALLQMMQEATTIIMDLAKEHDKDLIVTVHERVSEVPVPGSNKVMMKQTGDMKTREYLGAMNLKVAASIQGQFGIELARFFNEVYGLSIVMEDDKPVWKCRVKPDSVRDLRTSFNLDREEYEPNFAKIWRS